MHRVHANRACFSFVTDTGRAPNAIPSLPGIAMSIPSAAVVPSFVRASLGYLARGESAPVHYACEPPPGIPWESARYEERQIEIGDARSLRDPSVHREGFALRDAPTGLRDHRDEDEIHRVYYPELEALALAATGGRHACVFDHLVRENIPARGALNFGRATRGEHAAPNARIHNDYTERSGQRRLGMVLGEEVAQAAPRYCIVNIWRSLRGPVLDTPLAVCDARSVGAADLVEAQVRYPKRKGEIYVLFHAPRHRWWYYPGLDRHEALMFKQYDSQLGGVARFVPHAAFAHPRVPADTLPRLSIEARCLVLFD